MEKYSLAEIKICTRDIFHKHRALCQFGKETLWEDRMESFHSLAYEEEREMKVLKKIKGNGTKYAVK
jgi:hypothetical protein